MLKSIYRFSFKAGPSFLFPIWTTFWAVFHAVILLLLNLEIVYSSQAVTWYLDLTYWTNSLVVMSSVCDCFSTLFVHSCRRHLLESTAGMWQNGLPQYIHKFFYSFLSNMIRIPLLLFSSFDIRVENAKQIWWYMYVLLVLMFVKDNIDHPLCVWFHWLKIIKFTWAKKNIIGH